MAHPLNQSRLYKVKSLRQLAEILQVSPKTLRSLIRNKENYILFTTSTGRDVQWPKPALRRGHKRAAELLARIETPDFLHSAKRGRSYLSNAEPHVIGQPTVKLDIRKFFQSISEKAVSHFFREKMGCEPDVAAVLRKLLTVDGHLPAGGNASPILSYFAYADMFAELEDLARRRDCVMTCLMDDVTFTGPRATRELIYEARRIVGRHRLRIHKTKVFTASQPKVITGVAVTKSGRRVPNKRKAAIAEDFRLLRATKSADARLTVLRRLVGRIYEAAQLEPVWRLRVAPFALELRKMERLLRGEGRVSVGGGVAGLEKRQAPRPEQPSGLRVRAASGERVAP